MLTGEADVRAHLLDVMAAQKTATTTAFVTTSNPVTHSMTLSTPSLTFGAITAAGLIDSINPCALATVIFFVAYLRVRRLSMFRILVAGLSFCLGVFFAYLAIGWGLLKLLDHLTAWMWIRTSINWTMALGCAIFGVFSLVDFWRSRPKKTGGKGSAELILQLPTWAKRLMHSEIREHMEELASPNFLSVLVMGVFLGAIIAVIEGICTGQVYLPTLIYLTKTGTSLTTWLWLIWYNFLFVLPLLVLLLLVVWGISQKSIEAWFQKNILWTKLLLAILFFGLAILLVWH
jgi:cytochrome c biogenesis protein CcdA